MRSTKVTRTLPLAITGLMLMAMAPSGARGGWFSEMRVTYSERSWLAHRNAHPIAAGPDGKVHLVWHDDRGGSDEVYYRYLHSNGWTGEKRLSYEPQGSRGACVAVDAANRLHVAWYDYRHGNGEKNFEIYYRSGEYGSWHPEERLTDEEHQSLNPSLGVDAAGRSYVVWYDDRDGNYEVYFKKCDGVVWGEDVRLTDDAADSYYPMIAVSPEGEVHIVWRDNRDGNKEIYYKHFDGTAWSEDIRLTWDASVSQEPSICLDVEGRPHVVWSDWRDGNKEVYYKHFDGTAWQPDTRLTSAEKASTMPCIAADDSSNLHVVWLDWRDAGEGIYYKALSGSEWSEDKRLTERVSGVTKPAICVDPAGNLHVVWQDDRHGGQTIYWKERFNGTLERPSLSSVIPTSGNIGDTFPVRISGGDFVYPAVRLVRQGSADVVAADVVTESDSALTCNLVLDHAEVGLWDLAVRNVDGQSDTLAGAFEVTPGLVWGDAYRLTWDGAPSQTGESQCVDVDPAGDVHVVWHDMRDGKREIYYVCREGGFWGLAERLTDSGGGMRCPCVAADNTGRVHVVWQATVAGGYEIYYRCRDCGYWGDSRRFNRDPGFSLYPDMTTDCHGCVHVVWCDNYGGDFQVLYRMWNGTSWSRKAELTDGPGASLRPAIASGDDRMLHLVWQNDREGCNQIYYSKFDGAAWGAEERVSESTSEAIEPGIAVGPYGDIHVVWNDFRGTRSIYSKVYYRSKGTHGWEDELGIPGRFYDAQRPSVTVDTLGTVHIVWQFDYFDTRGIVWARGSSRSWKREIIVPRATDLTMLPSVVAAGDGGVHMVYCDDVSGESEIYYRRLSRDSAEPPLMLSMEPAEAFNADSLCAWIRGEGFQADPKVWLENSLGDTVPAQDIARKSPRLIECGFQMTAVSPGPWDLVMENRDRQRGRLEAAIKVLQGPWSLPEEISGDDSSVSTGNNNGRSIAREPNGVIHAVWRQNEDGDFAICYRQGFGDVWGVAVRLAEGKGSAGSPSIVFGPQHAMHLCWNDDRTGKSEVYYRKFHGTFWGPEQRISPDDSIRSENPSMTLDGDGRPFIFYRDRRYGPWQVICARWDGARWIEERVTEHENDVNNPACVTDPAGGINVFWESETGGTREIYHRVRGDSGWGESTKLAAFWSHSPTCACDSQGRVMVVWTESWYGKLRGALRYGGEWHDLAGIPGNGWSPNLTADGLGRFHLVYARNGKIDYQWYGETWSTPTRINRGTHGNTPFVAVDAAGHSIVIWTAGKDQDTRIMARRWEGDAAVTAVDETVAAPAEFGFARTEPNPFKAGTEIMFGLPFASDVSVSVFDVTGRLVWREDTEQLDPGFHSVVWGGSDAGGRKVSPGVYFAHLTAGAKVARTKLVLLR